MKKKVLLGSIAAIALVLVAGGIKNVTTASKGEYAGRVFIAGMGGHIADANVVIDPTDTNQPVKIPDYTMWTGNKLHFIPLGPPPNYATHDVRIDSRDSNIAFWSTYASSSKSVKVGKSDLRDNTIIAEKSYKLPKEVVEFEETTSKTLYCASGESTNNFLPIFMGYPGFIDVVDKDTLELKHRVMLSSNPELPEDYKFTHGVHSPDRKNFFIIMNGADEGHGKFTGQQHMFLLDMAALENGELKVVKKNTVDFPKGSITFRATYTPDGKNILQASKNWSVMINADDLTIKQKVQFNMKGWEAHDIMPTPDGKYGITAIRVPLPNCDDGKVDDTEELHSSSCTPEGSKKKFDGMIGLWDLHANKYIGEPVSVCRQCHVQNKKHFPLTTFMDMVGCTRCHQDRKNRNSMDVLGTNILCGLDGNLVKR